jgi:hypothetical protein
MAEIHLAALNRLFKQTEPALLMFVAIMAFESDYTHFTRVTFFGIGGASAQTETLTPASRSSGSEC